MANIIINTGAKVDGEGAIAISHLINDEVRIQIYTFSLNGGTINWGDGVIDNFVHGVSLTHIFLSNSSQIIITAINGLEDIASISSLNQDLLIVTGSFKAFNIFQNLAFFGFAGDETSTIISELPTSIQSLITNGELIGDVNDFSNNVVQISHRKENPINLITGNFNNFSSNLISLDLNKSSIDGDLVDLNSILISFNLEHNIKLITGNIINIPTNITSFKLTSPNTITGNIANLKPSLLTLKITGGTNTIHGDISQISPNLESLEIEGNNIIEGDFSSVILNFYRFIVKGFNNLTYENPVDFTSSTYSFFTCNINVSDNFTSTQIDNFLIDLNNKSWSGLTVILTGGSRTAASDVAYNNLIAQGYTITF